MAPKAQQLILKFLNYTSRELSMNRSIAAVVLTKQNLATPVGEKIQLTFKTKEGHGITIRSPIEDQYLAAMQPQDQVYFHRDRRGYHHLERPPFWQELLRWDKLPFYGPAHRSA
jgi:hypothetical protein